MATAPAWPPQLPNSPPDQLLTETNFAGGVVQDSAQDIIADNEAYYIQDGLLNNKGRLYKRGPISKLTGYVDGVAGQKVDGLASFIDSAGALKYLILTTSNGTHQFRLLDSTYNVISSYDTAVSCLYTDPDVILHANPAQGGEMLLGFGKRYSKGVAGIETRGIWRWKGAIKPAYTTGTISVTAGSNTVTGVGTLWVANAEPGMYMLLPTSGKLIGIVKKVISDTSITLEQNVINATAATQTYTLASIGGIAQLMNKAVGRVTASTGSAIVNGGATKFLAQGIIVNDAFFAIVSDQPIFLGTVLSVQSDTQLTLSANSTTACVNAKYISRNVNNHPSLTGQKVGFLNAYWNGMQFYGNQDAAIASWLPKNLSTIWIADSYDLEAVDLTQDGASLTLPAVNSGNFLTGMTPTETGLVVWRENETYLIQGSSPSTLRANKIWDDGCYGSTTVASYKGGVIWAGRKGIYAFDGSKTISLLDNRALKYYAKCIGSQALDSYRWNGFVQQDHYFLHAVYQNPIVTTSPTGDVTTFTHQAWVINLKTGALTFFTNMSASGSTTIPSIGTVFSQRSSLTASIVHTVCAAADFFGTGLGIAAAFGDDTTVSQEWSTQSFSPQFIVEGKLFSANRPEIKKKWKRMLLWQNVASNCRLDIFQGLDKAAVLTNSVVTALSVWKNIRFPFGGNSTHLGFRFSQTAANLGQITLGTYALMWRPQRVGKV